jgi:phosphoribosylglycinamide formyltransferase-1
MGKCLLLILFVQRINLAIFISGKGSNAVELINYFNGHPIIKVALLVSNNPHSPCLGFSENIGIKTIVCDNVQAADTNFLTVLCKQYEINFIALAGYLRKIPEALIKNYQENIFNIHPSLLPKFGGIGMYGDRVHEAVLASREKKSGITVHLVNAEYDKGRILAQFDFLLAADEDLNSIKEKIRRLEHENYGKVIANFILGSNE